jgi:hypothetical protein
VPVLRGFSATRVLLQLILRRPFDVVDDKDIHRRFSTITPEAQLGASAANLFNHPNYGTPNTSFNTAAFGTISSMQSTDGAGPRAVQLGARLTFSSARRLCSIGYSAW